MRNNLFLILFLLIAVPGIAGDYVCHDNGTITSMYKSIDGSNLVGCVKVDRETVESVTRFHKVTDGEVVEMSQAEKDAILQADADAQAQAVQDALDKYEVSQLEIITALVQVINKRIPNNVITKTEIINQIKANR